MWVRSWYISNIQCGSGHGTYLTFSVGQVMVHIQCGSGHGTYLTFSVGQVMVHIQCGSGHGTHSVRVRSWYIFSTELSESSLTILEVQLSCDD